MRGVCVKPLFACPAVQVCGQTQQKKKSRKKLLEHRSRRAACLHSEGSQDRQRLFSASQLPACSSLAARWRSREILTIRPALGPARSRSTGEHRPDGLPLSMKPLADITEPFPRRRASHAAAPGGRCQGHRPSRSAATPPAAQPGQPLVRDTAQLPLLSCAWPCTSI